MRLLCIQTRYSLGIVRGELYDAVGEYNCSCKMNNNVWVLTTGKCWLKRCVRCKKPVDQYYGLPYAQKRYFVPLYNGDLKVTEQEVRELYQSDPQKEKV